MKTGIELISEEQKTLKRGYYGGHLNGVFHKIIHYYPDGNYDKEMYVKSLIQFAAMAASEIDRLQEK